MTTTVKIEHRGGSHPVLVAVSGVPRGVLYAPGDAWEGVVYQNGGEISVTEHEAPSRPDVLGLGSDAGSPDDRLRAAETNMAAADAYVKATEDEANYARKVAADARAAYVKLQTDSAAS